jgi:hypothetical protein
MCNLRGLNRCGYRRASTTRRNGRCDRTHPLRFAIVASGLMRLVRGINAGHVAPIFSFPKSRQNATVVESEISLSGHCQNVLALSLWRAGRPECTFSAVNGGDLQHGLFRTTRGPSRVAAAFPCGAVALLCKRTR